MQGLEKMFSKAFGVERRADEPMSPLSPDLPGRAVRYDTIVSSPVGRLDDAWAPPRYRKSDEATAAIVGALGRSVIFEALPDGTRDMCAAVGGPRERSKNISLVSAVRSESRDSSCPIVRFR